MISYLEGLVRESIPGHITVITHGIGFALSIPRSYHIMPNEQIKLEIFFHCPPDQSPQLYGFYTREERKLFGLIIGCSGFGPKIGLAMLSALSVSNCALALQMQDVRALSAIEGIGRKKAENLIMQLRDKVSDFVAQESGHAPLSHLSDALTALGYSKQEIAFVLNKLHEEPLEDISFPQLMKKSLSFLVR